MQNKKLLLIASLAVPQLLFQLPANADQWNKNSIQLACDTYQTNKFDKKAKVEGGGWTTSWAEDVSETDVGLGLVAVGVDIYGGGGSAFALWVENLVQRTVSSLGRDLSANVKKEATNIGMQIIREAIAGKSSKQIIRQFDTLDIKAGAIRYSGRNREPVFCNTISTTWGMKPYIAFRVRPSSDNTIKTSVAIVSSKVNRRVLDFTNSRTNGEPVLLVDEHRGDSQQWQLVPLGNGYHLIKSKVNGRVLDFTNSRTNGEPVLLVDEHRGDSQQWRLDSL